MWQPRTLPVGNGVPLQAALLRNLITAHGEPAVDMWLSTLPAVLNTWCERWKITIADDVPESGYNVMLYAASAIAGPVVLKMNLASPEFLSEMEAIAQTSGHGIVRLIDADPDLAIMMLERIDPGTTLRASGKTEQEATLIGVDVMRRFWRPPARLDNLFPLREWISSLLDYPMRPTYPDGPIPVQLIDRAIETAEHLLNTQADPVLLHGDIHHDNILWGGHRGWVTIDPKGLIGERGFDTATWMHNPPDFGYRPNVAEPLRERLAIFATELGLDPYRTAQWAFMFLVLSMCWSTEAEGYDDFAGTMRCAIEMERIMDELATSGK